VDLTPILADLLSPPVLFFIFGILTVLFKSDLEIPPAIAYALAVFLLISIGLEGGSEVVEAVQADAALFVVIGLTALFGILVAVGSTLVNSGIFKGIKFSTADAWALAALYGAVSSATMIAAVNIASAAKDAAPDELIYVGWMPAANVFLDAPGVIAAMVLGRLALSREKQGIGSAIKLDRKELIRESIFSYAIWLMIGGLVIGVIAQQFAPGRMEDALVFFDDLFIGVLCLYLIDMGMLAGRRLGEIKALGSRMIPAFLSAVGIPHLWAITGLLGLYGINVMFPGTLGWGDAFVFAAMAGSASYISAPPAVRAAIPEANPSIYLTMSLAITFPFNLLVSLPIWAFLAKWLWAF